MQVKSIAECYSSCINLPAASKTFIWSLKTRFTVYVCLYDQKFYDQEMPQSEITEQPNLYEKIATR